MDADDASEEQIEQFKNVKRRLEKDSLDLFEKMSADFMALVGKEKPMNGYDYMLIAKMAAHFMNFGYRTIKIKNDAEAAHEWLVHSMALIAEDVGETAGAELNLPVVWRTE